jgi:hypothetical protein
MPKRWLNGFLIGKSEWGLHFTGYDFPIRCEAGARRLYDSATQAEDADPVFFQPLPLIKRLILRLLS